MVEDFLIENRSVQDGLFNNWKDCANKIMILAIKAKNKTEIKNMWQSIKRQDDGNNGQF